MAEDSLSVSPSDMMNTADSYAQIGALAKEIGRDLTSGLAGFGDFAGRDEVGNQFHAVWDPSVAGLEDSVDGFGDGMNATADGIKTSADAFNNSNIINTRMAVAPPIV